MPRTRLHSCAWPRMPSRATIRFMRRRHPGGWPSDASASRPRRSWLAWRIAGGPVWIHRSPGEPTKCCSRCPSPGAPGSRGHGGRSGRRTAGTGQPWSERLAAFRRAGRRLDAAGPDPAQRMALEIGKPLALGHEEVHRGADDVRDAARRAGEPCSATTAGRGAGAGRHPGCRRRHLRVEQSRGHSPGQDRTRAGLREHRGLETRPLGHSAWPRCSWVSCVKAGVPRNAVSLVTGDSATAQRLAGRPGRRCRDLHRIAPSRLHDPGNMRPAPFMPFQAELSGNNASSI